MNSSLSRASLNRSPRIARKDNVAATISRSASRRKTRPPPLQIIPELSENELDYSASPHSPETARPKQLTPRQSELDASRITLSAYDFSIDDALLMLGDDSPRSPALSASSSTSDGTSSEDVLPTPGTSDDEDVCTLPTPRLCPRRISIRPLCITKTRSLVCPEGEDIHDHFEREEGKDPLPVIEEPLVNVERDAMQDADEDEDFYTHEFEDFISLSPVVPSPTFSARRDSLILSAEIFSALMEAPEIKSRGRSRHSKPLPLIPPATPPISTLPLVSTFPLIQTSARTSIVRRKRNVPLSPGYPPLSPPAQSRPLPRVTIPLDIEDNNFSEEDFNATTRGPIVIEQVYDAEEDAGIYSRSSIGYGSFPCARSLPPAMPEICLANMYGEVGLPRASIDSDAPRSSVDSITSFAFPASSNTSVSPSSFPSTPSSDYHGAESTQRLCSRWSCSTLDSLDVEPTRTTSLLSPLRNVLGSRVRRTPPPQKSPPRTPPDTMQSKSSKNKHGSSMTTSSPSTPEKRIRRQESRSSTSSTECDSRDGSPSRLKRKPIPIAMFLRV